MTYTLDFPTVTQETFLKLKTKLGEYAAVHLNQDGDLDITSDLGIKAKARYNAASQILSVELIDRPWFVTVTAFRNEIQRALQRAA